MVTLHRELQRTCLLTNELYKSHLSVSTWQSPWIFPCSALLRLLLRDCVWEQKPYILERFSVKGLVIVILTKMLLRYLCICIRTLCIIKYPLVFLF